MIVGECYFYLLIVKKWRVFINSIKLLILNKKENSRNPVYVLIYMNLVLKWQKRSILLKDLNIRYSFESPGILYEYYNVLQVNRVLFKCFTKVSYFDLNVHLFKWMRCLGNDLYIFFSRNIFCSLFFSDTRILRDSPWWLCSQ